VWQQAANRMHAVRALLARSSPSRADGGTADGDARQAAAPAPHRALLEEQAISSQAQLVELLAPTASWRPRRP
jgi:hypothetical protein